MLGSVHLNFRDRQGELWSGVVPSVVGTGFLPLREVVLRVSCVDGAGATWSSLNRFLVDARGDFDTSKQPAMGDSYFGICPEGPLFSLTREAGPGHDFVLPDSGILTYELSVDDGDCPRWQGTFLRKSETSAQAYSETLEEGMSVAFFHNGSPAAQHGSNLLNSLGFFTKEYHIGAECLDLASVLQTFETQLKESSSVVLLASGRASEAALEVAIRSSQPRQIVLFSGSGLRFNPWRFGSEELTYIPCDHASLAPQDGEILVTRSVYAEAVADRKLRDLGRIEVEKIHCPVTLFSGLDDQIWPSSAFSELIYQRRKAFPQLQTEHHTYVNVGHDLGPEFGIPTLPTSERTVRHPETQVRLHLGGKISRQGQARRECWNAMLRLLSQSALTAYGS